MPGTKSPFNLQTCARPNILALEPYRCARDDYKDDGTNILLDANENAFGPAIPLPSNSNSKDQKKASEAQVDLYGLNRYPDPHQHPLKQLLCDLRNTHVHTPKNITPDNLFVGVGSDEAIDALLRCFCVPGKDKILVCPPTYGMYSVSAQVNDVGLVKVPLLPAPEFAIDVPAITSTLSSSEASNIKIIYICSPGNPTGSLIKKEDLQQVLEHPTWNGVVVLDEAYIDFAPDGSSLAEWVVEWPNLVVMQTLSKAFGLAGIRLGAAFTSPPIASLLNNLKAPYNISNPTSEIARSALSLENLGIMASKREQIIEQRDRLLAELPKIKGVGRFRGGTASNFLLVEILDAQGKPNNATALKVYETLAQNRGVVVRFRGKEHGCLGCVRITVGTEEEVTRFLEEIKDVLKQVHSESNTPNGSVEEKKEQEANAVIS
ncbi:histidinol-phosphate aminotransferase-like protein [Cadophora sp. MPI-SDFR-AT-0126]|nr:histidinol-phosphate aminotransferase-like protein [Leotiomycetes sp. MPI-SDFR-AT-0126]